MVTDKMLEAFYSKAEVTSRGTILHLSEAIEAALSVSDAEPIAWESTTVSYTKYVTDARYQKFSDEVKKWYKPFRCSSCAAPPTVAVKALEWTEPTKPNEECSYDHVRASAAWTYQIEWKSWKEYDCFALHRDGDFIGAYYNLEEAKAAAQADYEARVRAALVSPADTSPVFTVAQIVEKVKDYGQDSLPTSEYRQACDDLVEAFEALAAAPVNTSPDAVDAARYRFLRDRVQPSPMPPERCITVEVCDWAKNIDANARFNMWSSAELSGPTLDAEIDKLLAAAPKEASHE